MSPKRREAKDSEGEGDSKVDGNKSNAEAKLNDVAGADLKAEAQEKAPDGGQLTAEKVRATRRWLLEHNALTTKVKSGKTWTFDLRVEGWRQERICHLGLTSLISQDDYFYY